MGQDPDQQDVETYGLRVPWQPEAEKIEAAEFLLATRSQQEHRLRIAKELTELRHLGEAP